MIKKNFISIITIVKNDRGIENTLNQLKSIVRPADCETLVIDASNSKLDDIKNKFPEVRWIYYSTQNIKKTTIPEQRNLGLKEARGDIVIFIDANCVPVNNWLMELYNSYNTYPDGIVFGPVIPKNNSTLNNIWDSNNKSKYRYECPSGNILISKKVFKKIGSYDESLLYGEDIDFTWRAIDAGFKIRFNEKAIVSHDWGSLSDEIKRSYRYGKARAILYKKHYHRWGSIIGDDKIAIAYALFVLGLPITILFPFYPLLMIVPIAKNIKKLAPKMITKLVLLNLINGIGIIEGFLFGYRYKQY